MTNKNNSQSELLMEAPADITTGKTGEAPAAELEIIDDTPEKPSADLRKFNRAAAEVSKALAPLKLILKISDTAGVDSAMLHMKAAKGVENMIENKRKDLVGPWNTEVKRINGHAADLVKDMPTEINRVKGLVLDFNKAEQNRLLKIRTEDRHKEMELSGLKYCPDGSDAVLVPHYVDPQVPMMVYRHDLETASDELWLAILNNLIAGRTKRLEKQVEALEKQAEGATFFGEDTTEIMTKVAEIKTAPIAPVSYGGGGSYAPAKLKGATKTWTYEIVDIASIPIQFLQVDEVKIRQAIAAGSRSIAGINIFQKDSISLR